MATFTRSDDLEGAEFTKANLRKARFRDSTLRGTRFVSSDLSEIVMRGVDLEKTDIDAPWLPDGDNYFLVNGVDVVPYVEAELNRRFPGRADRRATTPEALRKAWSALEQTWATTLDRVAAMPPETIDISVDDEWTFAQTLRHLILATDAWLGRSVLTLDQPFHPLGLVSGDEDHLDLTVFTKDLPTYAEILEARAGRQALVRNYLSAVTPADLSTERRNPWSPEYPESTLTCIHVVLEEEWEHHRYAVRDLDAIASNATT